MATTSGVMPGQTDEYVRNLNSVQLENQRRDRPRFVTPGRTPPHEGRKERDSKTDHPDRCYGIRTCFATISDNTERTEELSWTIRN